MTVLGGVLETKEIGLDISLTGTHNNTEVINGILKLKSTRVDGLGNPIYAESGEWISRPVMLIDNFNDYDKIFTTNTVTGDSSFKIQTRVSDNNIDWDDWIDVNMSNGKINSEKKQYIQVKIIFEAGFIRDAFIISEFGNNDENFKYNFDNDFHIETKNGLKLKRDYSFDITIDNTWTDEGVLYRQKITRDEWIRIDKMNVLTKE